MKKLIYLLLILSACNSNKDYKYNIKVTYNSVEASDVNIGIIKSRLELLGINDIKVQKEDLGFISLDFFTNVDTFVLKRILTKRGNVQLFETYDNKDINPYMHKIGKLVIDSNILPVKRDNILHIASDPLNGLYSLIETSTMSLDSSNRDIARDTIVYSVPFVLRAKELNKDKIDSLLSLPQLKSVLPKDLRLFWSFSKTNDEMFLYTIKSLDLIAPIQSNMIDKVLVKSVENKCEIFIALKPDYVNSLYDFTSKNNGKTVAIAIDNEILGYPKIVEPIKNGSLLYTAQMDRLEEDVLVAFLKNSNLSDNFEIKNLKIKKK